MPNGTPWRARAPFLILLLLLAPLLFMRSCRGEQVEREIVRPAAPVLILGVDGLEWSVVSSLVAAGELPRIAALLRSGTSGALTTLQPTLSPRLWNSIATGKAPHRHGIEGFVKEAQGGKRRKYTSYDRKVKPYWHILTDYGLRSATIGWWNTWPAEAVHGLMVAQTNLLDDPSGIEKGRLHEDVPAQVWPRASESEVLNILQQMERTLNAHSLEVFGDFLAGLAAEQRMRWRQCAWAFRADATYVRVLQEHLAKEPPPAVSAIYLGGADVVSHRFWSALYPQADAQASPAERAAETSAFGHVIHAYYRYVDRVLGELLELLPPESSVFLISDHGMGPVPPSRREPIRAGETRPFTGAHMQGEPAFFLAAGTGLRPGTGEVPTNAPRRLGTVMDFCPTLLALLGIPFGEDMLGRPLESVLDPLHLATRPLRSIATHDDEDWLKQRKPGGDYGESPLRLEQLRALGYLGDEED